MIKRLPAGFIAICIDMLLVICGVGGDGVECANQVKVDWVAPKRMYIAYSNIFVMK